MSATSYNHGAPIEFDYLNNQWAYLDDKISILNNPRLCPKCSKMPTEEGYDGCLGKLPGILEACCGHGIRKGYIIFENGKKIYFDNISDLPI